MEFSLSLRGGPACRQAGKGRCGNLPNSSSYGGLPRRFAPRNDVTLNNMKIKLAAVQFLPKAGDIPSNLERMEKLITSASKKGAGLVVLPEICDIGYDLEVVKKLAVTYKDSSAGSFSKMAKRNNIIVVAGMAERTKEGLFNGLYVFDPKGVLAGKYYKSHLCAVPPFNEPADFCSGDFSPALSFTGSAVLLS